MMGRNPIILLALGHFGEVRPVGIRTGVQLHPSATHRWQSPHNITMNIGFSHGNGTLSIASLREGTGMSHEFKAHLDQPSLDTELSNSW